jgi:hypothetical protein
VRFLGRAPTPPELRNGLGLMRRPFQEPLVLGMILSSDEYFSRT